MKLSFIVPVFNVEEYVEECIYSILKQKKVDFEVIIINDGSTDRSLERINSIKDERLITINQKNLGLSAARNKGLQIAKGEFISFIDSDDFIKDEQHLSEIVNLLENNKLDVVYGQALKFYSKNKTVIYNSLSTFDNDNNHFYEGEVFLEKCLQKKITYAPVCFGVYRRKTLQSRNIQFKEGILNEDEEFTINILTQKLKIGIYQESFYMYRQREGSIVTGKSKKIGSEKIDLVISLEKYAMKITNIKIRKKYLNYLATIVLTAIASHEVDVLTKETKIFINKNSTCINSQIRNVLLKIDCRLLIFFEKVYRNIKRNKNGR